METAVNLNINNKQQTPNPSIRANSNILATSISNVIEKSIIVNNTSRHITFSRTIEYNEVNSYVEGKVIDVNTKTQLEMDKILKTQRCIYVAVLSIPMVTLYISWFTNLLKEDASIVLRPMSIAIILMLALDYLLRRAK